jgi:hypothetical protein
MKKRNKDGSYRMAYLRKLAEEHNTKARVYWMGGNWILQSWCEPMKLWNETTLSPYIKTEREALTNMLQRLDILPVD